MATVYYKGLTGIVGNVSVTLATTTIDMLISAIAVDEGLPTEYYHLSLENDPSVSDIAYGDSTAKLSAIGFVDGSKVVCNPNQNGTREYRQIQKLEIAQRKRTGGLASDSTQGDYYRPLNTYNRDDLPTKYSGNNIVDNPNVGGLKVGRPWS